MSILLLEPWVTFPEIVNFLPGPFIQKIKQKKIEKGEWI